MPNWNVGPHKSFDTLVVLLMKDKDQAAREYFKKIPKWHQDNIITLATDFLETPNDAVGTDEGMPPKYMTKFYKRLIKVMTDA
jgi:hypothetical protein